MSEPKFQPGDRVLIARKHRSWNREGKMDHWLGEVMTIAELDDRYFGYYKMEEDQGEWEGRGWSWAEECLEFADEQPLEVKENDILSLLEVM